MLNLLTNCDAKLLYCLINVQVLVNIRKHRLLPQHCANPLTNCKKSSTVERCQNKKLLTSKLSDPPTILTPSPAFPLFISIIVSLPGMMGQVKGSWLLGADIERGLVVRERIEDTADISAKRGLVLHS